MSCGRRGASYIQDCLLVKASWPSCGICSVGLRARHALKRPPRPAQCRAPSMAQRGALICGRTRAHEHPMLPDCPGVSTDLHTKQKAVQGNKHVHRRHARSSVIMIRGGEVVWCVLQLFRAPRGRIQPLSQMDQDLQAHDRKWLEGLPGKQGARSLETITETNSFRSGNQTQDLWKIPGYCCPGKVPIFSCPL